MTDLGNGHHRRPETRPQSANGNGNGDSRLANYRLGELERRMDTIEGKADDLISRAVKIEERLNEVATKSYVLWVVIIVAGGSFATLVGHLIVRSMMAGS